jgi:hypothetical protein
MNRFFPYGVSLELELLEDRWFVSGVLIPGTASAGLVVGLHRREIFQDPAGLTIACRGPAVCHHLLISVLAAAGR